MLESAIDISAAIVAKKVSAAEVFQRSIERIKKMNPFINAIIDCENEFDANGMAPPIPSQILAGVPIAFKDNICVKDKLVSAGSKILRAYRSPFSATVVERLFSSGARYLGRCNLDEFAMGSTSETSQFGPVKNPWNLAYSAGGSSGGSAAAVACGMTPVTIGTDTGGSIRLPASHCGVLGLKPTYGSLSRFGLVAYGSSLDQPGPIARTVGDIEAAFGAMVGYDERDSTSVPALKKNHAEKKQVARFPKLENGIKDATVKRALDLAHAALEREGYQIVNLEIGLSPEEIMAVYYIIAVSEASSNLARFDGLRYGVPPEHRSKNLDQYYKSIRGDGFGFEVKARIMMGTFCLSEGHYDDWFIRAAKLRRVLKNEFDAHLQRVDGFLLPVSSSGPPLLGAFSKDPMDLYRQDSYTAIANLIGYPSISIPMTFTENKLPIGVQLMTGPFCEPSLFRWARVLERENSVLTLWPSISKDAHGD